mmetsp:Transcript_33647/g.89221  ORF Transcript_33647/g.89221 Transcript_33647/m.89221 type:complete len:218 (+) Transcript_33647:29-682(+)
MFTAERPLRSDAARHRGLGGRRAALLAGHRQEELELGGQLLLAVEAVREVDAADPAIGVELHAQRLDVVRAVGPAGEVREVELDLVPALIQAHGHGADEGLHARRALVVGGPEAPADLLVVQDHDLEREVLLEVLDDHHQEGQLDPERLARVRGAGDEGGAHVRAHDLQHAGLDVGVRQPLDVAVAHLLVPDLERLAADRVEDGEEARLVGVLEHPS